MLVIRVRPTPDGRLVTWVAACLVDGFHLGTVSTIIAWAFVSFRASGVALLLKLMVVWVFIHQEYERGRST